LLQIVGNCDKRIFGLTPPERLKRQVANAPGTSLVADASAVLGDTAVQWLSENPGKVLTSPSGRPLAIAGGGDLAGGEPVNAAELPTMFIRKLRRRDHLLVRSAHEQPVGRLERELFAAVYKGVTDVVTKYAWPLPALWVTRLCARLGVPPNAVTVVGILSMLIAAYLWTEGQIVGGLLCAWLMTFLDTVDGKLARVTVTSSEFGNKLDHLTDIIHPPIWWVCLAVGLNAGRVPELTSTIGLSCIVILVTYVVGRVVEGAAKVKLGFNPFMWRPFDSAFRLVVSRRNIILLIMTVGVIAGAPVLAFEVCAAWSLISVALQIVRYVQAPRASGEAAPQPWLM
jgi:phosphatidylglycerophosphate synthase